MSIYTSTVTALYLAFYGRPADPDGMKFWTQQLENANGDVNAIKTVFATSEEAQARFGADTAVERITEIYQQLFDREPEAEGLAYWVDVVSKGNASVADVAIAVLNGARGADRELVELRKQAADSFTAEVEASGSGYAGPAAVEAGRVLVRAVKEKASKEDIDKLVKSTKKLADVATTNPEAVEALGDPEEVLTLLDGEEGAADPVTVVETLAETAHNAKEDAHALAALVKGGGMKNILDALPEGTTIKDVVGKLGKGGLPAALKELFPDGVPVAPAKPGKGDKPEKGEKPAKGEKPGKGTEDGDDDGAETPGTDVPVDDGAAGEVEADLDLTGLAGTQTVAYDGFDHDEIVAGFDSGTDKIAFRGDAAAALDANGDGAIGWAVGGAVEATTEAASVSLDVSGAGSLEAALQVLATALDVSKVALGGELLILAKDGSDAALLHYLNKDGDGQLDMDELTAVATFVDGAPAQADIVLVGVETAPAA